jgi:beta-glucuronidase
MRSVTAALFMRPDEYWTEDQQAAVYRAQFDMQSRIPFLRGTSPGILEDFRTPKRPLPGIQDYFDRKGLVNGRGRRTAAWQVVHDHYARLRRR